MPKAYNKAYRPKQEDNMVTYNLFILDDHPAVVEGVCSLLKKENYNIHCSTVLSDLINYLKNNHLDLLVLDYELRDIPAIEIVPKLRQQQPDLPILIYTMHSEFWIMQMLIKAEVNGIVTKGDKLEEVKKAAYRIMEEQEKYFSPTALNAVLSIMGDQSAKRSLTYNPSPRELEVIELLSNGLTSEEISQELNLSKNTIDTMRKNILLKSGAINVSHLMRIAFIKGWIKS